MVLNFGTLYLLSHIILKASSQTLEPILNLPQGEIRGSVEKSDKQDFWAFRGIPYAKAPTESLRLRDPEKHESWSSTLDATKFKSKCPQWDLQGKMVGEEDCLYINVFTPVFRVGGPSSDTFPVMVFVHGGNFQRGSSDPYGPERFVTGENKVVLVTFNYRIGVLGFLSTGDEACPGNLGLKDQILALKWVRDNIGNFGGDPNSITLFGQGAGAVSVLLHILSPQSKGLFHQAITESGSPFCNWTLEQKPYRYAVELARRLRCPDKSTSKMVECIRQKSISEVLEAQRDNKTFGDFPLRTAPVVDKDGVLPDTPDKLLNSADLNSIPLVSGVNKDDGALFYSLIKSYEDDLKRNSSFLLTRLIPMFLLTATDIRGNIESVSQAIYFYYFNGIDPTNITQVLQPFINMTSDAMFVACNYKTIQSYAEKGARVYMYTFEYRGETSLLELEQGKTIDYNGVSHGDELLYLFDIKSKSSVLTPVVDAQMKGQLPYFWTLFAKKGEFSGLSFQYPRWYPYTNEFKHYYKIDINPSFDKNQTSFRQRNIDLWLNFLPTLSDLKPAGYQEPVKYEIGGFGWTMLAFVIILLVVAVVLSVLLFQKSKKKYFTTKTEDK